MTLNTINGVDVQALHFQGTLKHNTAKIRILFPEYIATYTLPTTRLVYENLIWISHIALFKCITVLSGSDKYSMEYSLIFLTFRLHNIVMNLINVMHDISLKKVFPRSLQEGKGGFTNKIAIESARTVPPISKAGTSCSGFNFLYSARMKQSCII